MALGFSSHYNHDNQTTFGSLTKGSFNNETESTGKDAYVPSLIVGHNINGLEYDNCEFSVTTVVDYSQYASVIAEGSCSETAGSIAFSGDSGSFAGCDASGGGSVSFSGGGGVSSASFTC